ncbi:MAG: phosphotransferase [Planctomycetota bacterium]
MIEHWKLDSISSFTPVNAGSVASTIIIETSNKARYAAKKRRHITPASRDRSMAGHRIALSAISKGFPAAEPIRAVSGEYLVTPVEGDLSYELRRFVPGDRPQTPEDHHASGSALAQLHLAARDAPTEGLGRLWFHNRRTVVEALDAFAHPDTEQLAEDYRKASATVAALGASQWPACICHGDWHPGNIVTQNQAVRVILDFDDARLAPACTDLTTGALHASAKRADRSGAFDLARLRSFLSGYAEGQGRLPAEQSRAFPAMMVQAMLAETARLIAAHTPALSSENKAQPVSPTTMTDLTRGPLPGAVQLIAARTAWIEANSSKIDSALREAGLVA